MRSIRSLAALRALCDRLNAVGQFTQQDSPKLSTDAQLISELSTVGHLYVLRLLESSGVLWQKLDSCSLVDVNFAHSTLEQLISSAELNTRGGEISHLRSKHVVGLVWHLVKIASNLYSSIDHALVDLSLLKQDTSCSTKSTIKSTETKNNWDSVRYLLFKQSLKLAVQLLEGLQIEKVKLNSKDIQQILMLSRERILLSMPTTREDFPYRGNKESDLELDFFVARREALKRIEDLATSYSSNLSDSEFISVFLSCYAKDVSDNLISLLTNDLYERSSKGFLDITLNQCSALINSSRTIHIPPRVLKTVMSQLESSSFCSNYEDSGSTWADSDGNKNILQDEKDKPSTEEGPKNQPKYENPSLKDLGFLCKSLYHVECSKRLLVKLDRKLTSLLSTQAFNNLLTTKENPVKTSLNQAVMVVAQMMHLFARKDFRETKSLNRLIYIMPSIPWTDSCKEDMTVLGDFCWSLLTLRVDLKLLKHYLERNMNNLSELPLKQTVKLLGGFYNSLGGSYSHWDDVADGCVASGNESMEEIATYTLQSYMEGWTSEPPSIERDPSSSPSYVDPVRAQVHEYMRGLKNHFMDRVEEADDVQCISNFMFYVVSTLNNLSTIEYNALCSKWVHLTQLCSHKVKVEACTQVLWSLQKNRMFNEDILIRIRELMRNRIGICSMGQLALVCHTISSFNMLNNDVIVPILRRVERLANEKDSEFNPGSKRDMWDTKLVSLIWSIMLSDFTAMDISIIKNLIKLLRYIDWDLFLETCQHQDLRKVLQIHTSLHVELPRSYSYIDEDGMIPLIPNHVVYTASKASQAASSANVMSVSQDKIRRSLSAFGVRYKGEYEVYTGITVDFAVDRNQTERFEPDLLIEIDGPHHYNVICGDCIREFVQVGPHRLLPRGKTLYRNRILEKLGYRIETINWIEAHRRPIYLTLAEIFRRHNYPMELIEV